MEDEKPEERQSQLTQVRSRPKYANNNINLMYTYINALLWYAAKFINHPYKNIPLVYLSGVGRSGTTALRISLGMHKDVEYNGKENNIAYDLLETARHNCTYHSRKVAMQLSQGKYDRLFTNMIMGLLYPRPSLLKRPKMWMVSSDISPERADYLLTLHPKTKFVYIVRNGIEVVSSRMSFSGFKDKTFEWQCEAWVKAEEIVRWGQSREDFFLIRHESLLDEHAAECVFRELFAWLNIDNDPECLQALTSNKFHPTKVSIENEEYTKDLTKRSLRYHAWTDEQKESFGRICKPSMDYFGYDLPPKNSPTTVT